MSKYDMVSDWCSDRTKGTTVCRRCEVGIKAKNIAGRLHCCLHPSPLLYVPWISKGLQACVCLTCASFDSTMHHLPAELWACLFVL